MGEWADERAKMWVALEATEARRKVASSLFNQHSHLNRSEWRMGGHMENEQVLQDYLKQKAKHQIIMQSYNCSSIKESIPGQILEGSIKMKIAGASHSLKMHEKPLKSFKNLVKWFKLDGAEYSLHDKAHFSLEFFDILCWFSPAFLVVPHLSCTLLLCLLFRC